ncbi:unnamed protein product [Microthlaspi erraticum]|uniref:Uncharacterized protein n=1 Tax=Microthlaspi erraticum TaxID=1685480 RepID=A0A6D2JD81_9BRAS|nr:unnamed protein product [Microthlaspi erraticum]
MNPNLDKPRTYSHAPTSINGLKGKGGDMAMNYNKRHLDLPLEARIHHEIRSGTQPLFFSQTPAVKRQKGGSVSTDTTLLCRSTPPKNHTSQVYGCYNSPPLNWIRPRIPQTSQRPQNPTSQGRNTGDPHLIPETYVKSYVISTFQEIFTPNSSSKTHKTTCTEAHLHPDKSTPVRTEAHLHPDEPETAPY